MHDQKKISGTYAKEQALNQDRVPNHLLYDITNQEGRQVLILPAS